MTVMLDVDVGLDGAISLLRQRQAARSHSTPILRQLDNIHVQSPTHQSPGPLGCRLPADECTVVEFQPSDARPTTKRSKATRVTKCGKTTAGLNKSKTGQESTLPPEHSGKSISPRQSSAPALSLVQAGHDIVGKAPTAPIKTFDPGKDTDASPVPEPIPPRLLALLRPNSPADSAQARRPMSWSSPQARPATAGPLARSASSSAHYKGARPATAGSLGRPVTSSAHSKGTRPATAGSLERPVSSSAHSKGARPRSASSLPSRDKVSSKYLLGSSMSSLLKLKMDKSLSDSTEASPSGQNESAKNKGKVVHFERWKDIKHREVSKEEAAAFWNIDLRPPPPPPVQKAPVEEEDADAAWKPPAPPPMPPGVRQLSNDLRIPLCDMEAAVRIFSQYADFHDDDEEQNVYDATLHMSRFEEVLCSMCNVSRIEELPPEFVEEARRTADRDRGGDIDVKEFAVWYYAYSFSEEVTLNPEEKKARQLAKKLGLQSQDVDRYKQYFDKYDTERLGEITFDDFSAMVTGLLKVPAGHALPADRLLSMWRTADADGGGKVDFEEFCIFYMKTFDSDGGDAILDFYRNVRKVPMVV